MNSGIQFGGDILLYYNTGTSETPVWTAFAHATSHSRSGDTDMREQGNKDDGGTTGVKPGRHSPMTITIEGLCSYDGVDYDTIETLRLARTEISVKYSGRPSGDTNAVETVEDTDDIYWTCSGYFSSTTRTDAYDSDSTYSATITVNGTPTKATVS